MSETREITCLLHESRAADHDARQRLWTAVCDELHQMARGFMRREQRQVTFGPTALVNETYLRLQGGDRLPEHADRRYFFAAAAQSMRRILCEHARRSRRSRERSSDGEYTAPPVDEADRRLLEIDRSLDQLAADHPAEHEIVMLRVFGDVPLEEIANLVGTSLSTVKRRWRFARALLAAIIAPEAGHARVS